MCYNRIETKMKKYMEERCDENYVVECESVFWNGRMRLYGVNYEFR